MLRRIMLLAVLVCSASGFAHTFVDRPEAANPKVEKFFKFAKTKTEGAAADLVFVAKVAPVVRGENIATRYERVVKALLHKRYPITGDDGGYQFSVLHSAKTEDVTAQLKGTLFEEDADEIAKHLAPTVAEGKIVYLGEGQGNNTIASIIIVADTRSREIAILIYSNFGSDD